MTRNHLCMAAVLVVGILSGTALAQSSDGLIGTWKLNAAKSKGVKSGTTTIEAAGDGLKFTTDTVWADDTVRHSEFSGKFDGKDNPVTGNNRYGNSVAFTRVDAKTIRHTYKQDGKPTVVITIVLAADGQTRTSTAKGKDAKGQPVDTVSFYEKQ